MVQYVIFGVIVFILFLLLLLLSMKMKNSKMQKSDTRDSKKSVADLMNGIEYDVGNKCYRTEDGKYIDLIQIRSKDLINSSPDEVEYDSMKFEKLYKLYEEDLKLIVLNFPCDTKRQQEYFQRKIENTSNAVYKRFLQRKLDELVWLGKNNTTREFYYMVFADSAEEIEKKLITLKTVLHTGKDGLLQELPDEKKHQILYRINNKSSLVA